MTFTPQSGPAQNQHRNGVEDAESFATRLSAALAQKGWTLARAAREISRHLPNGEMFNPVNLSHYMHGRSFPRMKYWDAILRALDLEAVPYPSGQQRTRVEREQAAGGSRIKVQDRGDGTARVEIDHVVPWPEALRLLQLVTNKQN